MSDERPVSALERPRFFDDEAFSAWWLDGERFAAPKSHVSARSFTYAAADDRPYMPPEHPADPISVEIVRGANGAQDDKWTVIVDGIRCQQLPAVLQDGSDAFRCVLPPGVPFSASRDRARLTSETRVRPVVIGVRLEEEALPPHRATLTVEQVLDTSERHAQKSGEDEVRTIKTVELKPYRVTNVESSCVSLQYPYHAPCPSVLGILSLEANKRWEEDKNLALAWNVVAPAMSSSLRSASFKYNGPLSDRDRIETDPVYSAVRNATGATTQTMSPLQEALRKRYARRKVPTLKAVSVPSEPADSKSVRIGGGSKCSARELGELFEILTVACEQTRDSANTGSLKDSVVVQERIKAIEVALVMTGDTKALTLLRALCHTNINKVFKRAIEFEYLKDAGKGVKYMYKYDTDGSLTNATTDKDAAQRTEFVKDVLKTATTNPTTVKAIGSPYLFTYDRFFLPSRDQTVVYTRFRVSIEDAIEPLNVEFVASRDDGIVANSVYSGEIDDVYYMDEQAKKFVSRLMEIDTSVGRVGGAASSTRRRANHVVTLEAFKQKVTPSSLGKTLIEVAKIQSKSLLQRMSPGNVRTTVGEIETRVAELRVMTREILPVWPPVQLTNDQIAEADEARGVYGSLEPSGRFLAHQVLSLRAMMTNDNETVGTSHIPRIRMQHPIYTLLAHPQSTHYLAARFAFCRVLSGIVHLLRAGNLMSSITSLPVEPSVGVTSLVDQISALNFAEGSEGSVQIGALPESEETATAEENIFVAKQEEAIKNHDSRVKSDESTSLYDGRRRVLVRKLPQIVKPSVVVQYSFTTPDATAPPDLYNAARPIATTRSWTTFIPSKRTVLAAIGVYSASYFIFALGLYQIGAEADRLLQKLVETSTTSTILDKILNSGFDSTLKTILTGYDTSVRQAKVLSAASIMTQIATATNLLDRFGQLANVLFSDYKASMKGDKEFVKKVNDHSRITRGIPVEEAFAAARHAATHWAERERERLLTQDQYKQDASVAYNPVSGRRFCFYECFLITGVRMVGLTKPICSSKTWMDTPNMHALRILPPPDVEEMSIECEQMRGIRISQTVAFVTGTAPSRVHASAEAAFREISRMVVTLLVSMHNGQRIEQSPGQLLLDLTIRSANLIQSAYGRASGVTLVESDDIIWTCMQASTCARIALRHLSIFSGLPVLGTNGIQFVKSSIGFWTRGRREVASKFAEALVLEAREFVKLDPTRQMDMSAFDRIIEHRRLLDRVRVLNNSNSADTSDTLRSVASAYSGGYKLPSGEKGCGDQSLSLLYADTSLATIDFSYQNDLNPNVVTTTNEKIVWASRRLDTALSRSLCIGHGIHSIVDALSYPSTMVKTTCVFYSPVGGRLNSLPGNHFFDTDSINQRVVWLEPLKNAARAVVHALQEHPVQNGAWCVKARFLDDQARKMTGLSRHPSTILLDDQSVHVGLSKPLEDSVGGPSAHKTDLMRSRAYNADRLMFATSLAYSSMDTSSLAIEVPSGQAPSFALALAMRYMDGGEFNVEITVHVQGAKKELESLQALVSQSEAALAAGCKVCRLSEIALCM